MSRVVLNFVLFSFLFASTEFVQFLKLPSLLRHYSQHRDSKGSLDFFDFLHMHYVGDDQNPYDDDEDNQLPFKSPAQLLTTGGLLPMNTYVNGFVKDLQVKKNRVLNEHKPLPAYRDILLQPPKFA